MAFYTEHIFNLYTCTFHPSVWMLQMYTATSQNIDALNYHHQNYFDSNSSMNPEILHQMQEKLIFTPTSCLHI